MKYRVEWLSGATRSLLDLVASGQVSETELVAASFRIESLLGETPLEAGESRESDRERVLFEPPLILTYDVRALEETVRITAVRPCKSPGDAR